jgi:hypothetical protein
MKLRRIPSPATLISLVALFVALGGTAYAVATVDSSDVVNNSLKSIDVKNSSLTTSDVKNETLKSSDVKNESLTSADVQNESLTNNDVKNGSLLAADFAAGQIPAGPRGFVAYGPDLNWTGATQTPVTLNLPAGSYVLNASTQLNNNSANEEFIQCVLFLGAQGLVVSNGEDVGPNTGDDREFVSLNAAGTIATDSIATLTCNPNGAANGNYLQATITAVKVDAIG